MKFSYDNIIFRGLNKFVDCVYACLLWLVCSLPMFTFGAATSALYYTVRKSIRGGREYVGRSFFKAFRENFKQATLAWLIYLCVVLILSFDLNFMRQLLKSGNNLGLFYYVFLVAIVFVIGWGCFLFPYIARFANTLKATLKNAVFLELRHLPWSLLLIVLLGVAAFAVWLIWPLIFLVPALLCMLFDGILERIFRKYMSEEDLARELEIEAMDKLENSK